MFTDTDALQESKLKTGLYEVLQIYIQLYQNLEVRINDMLNQGRLTPTEALDSLTSYAIAEEGTNTLYLGLIEKVCQRDTLQEPYSVQEAEMILNYFPHQIWQETQQTAVNEDVSSMRERFYFPIVHLVVNSWQQMSDEQFLAIFQGLTLAGA